MTGMYSEIASCVLKCVISIGSIVFTAIVIPWLKNNAIPWLKEKQIYSLVQKFVRAAEKLADSGAIDKKQKYEYVLNLLRGCGVDITSEIEAFIESAVGDLDDALNKGIGEVGDVFDGDDAGEDEPGAGA